MILFIYLKLNLFVLNIVFKLFFSPRHIDMECRFFISLLCYDKCYVQYVC